MNRHILIALGALLFVAGCAGSQPTTSPTPTNRPAAANTPAPTATAPVGTALPATVAPPSTAASPTPAAITITGDDGVAISLASVPQKVVSLTPATSELMFALGAGDRLAGRTDYDDYPPDVASVSAVATFQGVEMEKVVNIGPDLVLAGGNNFTSAADIQRMRDLGFPVLVVYAPDVSGVLSDIKLVGQAVGEQDAADHIVGDIQARLDEVTTAVADLPKPSTFYEISVDTEIYGPAPDSFVADMVGIAGGDPVTTTDPAVFSISLERLVSLDPEIIVLGDAAYGMCPDAVAARPGWKGISAVKNDHIIPVDDTIVTRPGPRLGEGLAALALAIHPEAAIAQALGTPDYCSGVSPSPGPS